MSLGHRVSKLVADHDEGLTGKAPHWERIRLGDIAVVVNGFPFPSDQFSNTEGIPLLRIRDVLPGKTGTFCNGPTEDAPVVRRGDLVIGMDGNFNCRLWPGPDALLNQRVCKVVPDEALYANRLLSYVLPLQQKGARDFFWKARIIDIDRNHRGVDIHHIFSRKWCEDHEIGPRVYDSIINKTAISYKANRKIGGKAPSAYLEQLQNDPLVQLSASQMDAILETHCINPKVLRADEFEGFMADRKATLFNLIQEAMGKAAVPNDHRVSNNEQNDGGIDTED